MDVVVPDPGLRPVPLDEVVDVREDRPLLHRIRPVARDRLARLGQPFPVGDVEQLERVLPAGVEKVILAEPGREIGRRALRNAWWRPVKAR
jgi:hypothetical protein